VDDGLHRDAAFVGVVATIQGAGSIVGGIAAGRILRRVAELKVLGIAAVACGVGLVPLTIADLAAVSVGVVVFGFGVALFNVAYFTLLQRRTPVAVQGRVFAASEAILNLPFGISIAVGALLVERIGFRTIYVVNALALGACGAFLLLTRVPSSPPASEPPTAEPHPVPEGLLPPT
jgi:MFS family permease